MRRNATSDRDAPRRACGGTSGSEQEANDDPSREVSSRSTDGDERARIHSFVRVHAVTARIEGREGFETRRCARRDETASGVRVREREGRGRRHRAPWRW